MNELQEPARGLKSAWDTAALVALACYGFFAPFSSAGVSISGMALVVLVLMSPRLLADARPWKEPVFMIGLSLWAWITVHTLVVTGANGAGGSAINHYHELVLAPLMFAVLLDERRRRVFFAGLTGGLLTVSLAYWFLALAPAQLPFAPELLHARRISAGFAIAFGAFLWLMHAKQSARPWVARTLAATFATTTLFAIDGRTGHVVLLALAAYAAWELAPLRWRHVMALGIPALLLIVAVLGSGAVRNRLHELRGLDQVASPPTQLDSTGIRIELARLAIDLAGQHGLAGVGYANYSKAHEEAALARYTGDPVRAAYLTESWVRTPNPHNEYFMQLLGGGAAALLMYLAWLGSTWRQGLRLGGPVGPMLSGAALAFGIGSLFNSLLLDFIEAHVYAGVLAALVAAGRKPLASAEPTSVLVIVTRQIGDVLLTTPLIHAIRQRWPHCRIDVLGFRGTLGMLAGNGDVHQSIESDPRRDWRGDLALLCRLWRRYDLAFVAEAGDRAHLIGWAAAPLRSGLVPEEGGSRWCKRASLDHTVQVAGDRGRVHVVMEKLALLAPWVGPASTNPKVVPPPGSPLPEELDAQLRPGAVVVHAPSMWDFKQWPLEHFASLVQQLLAEGRQVVLTGSASPRDRACISKLRILGEPPQLLEVAGRLGFRELVTLFGRAALYIGPDTSVSHLAAACGIPVVAVFGPTNPMRWAPWPHQAVRTVDWVPVAPVQRIGNVTLVQSTLPCVPCGLAGCDNHRHSRSDCLRAITPERVIEAARAALETTEPTRSQVTVATEIRRSVERPID